jgi:lipid-A-disaccharide synthase-like uncharacterized protein
MNELGGNIRSIFVDRMDAVVLLGYLGQIMFTARFLVQWLASERAGRSVIPLSFWFFSIGGGVILFGYAIYREDPVFILGQAAGLGIYLRNLFLIAKEKSQTGYTTSGPTSVN